MSYWVTTVHLCSLFIEKYYIWTHPASLSLSLSPCNVLLLGGGEDKGRLWWWEQEGKATIPENRRVLHKHHWRCIWATQGKSNVAAIEGFIHHPISMISPTPTQAHAREQPSPRSWGHLSSLSQYFLCRPREAWLLRSGHLHILCPLLPVRLHRES